MRLRESRLAAADLDAIFEFGTENFGIEAALAYIEQIQQRYEQLLAHPRSGREDPELRFGVRSISYRSHRIYYEVDDATILILRILHKSRDVRAWLD